MHKCENCGAEFPGKFCPECGTPAPLEACPNCGAKLSPADKFCPECGKPLRAPAAKPQPAPATPAASVLAPKPAPAKKAAASPALVKFLSLLPYTTAILFGLFSALLFLMLLGSVSSVMGFGTGSVYDYLSMGGGSSDGGFSDIFGGGMSEMVGADTVINLCTALVVFAALGAVLAVCALAFRLSVSLRVKKIGNFRVCTLLNGCIFLFYFVDFLLACILCGTVSDEITSPDAGPICVLVFALLFGLCSAGALLMQKFSPKIFPAAAAELERKKAERRATLTPPAKPEWKELAKPKKPKKPKIKQYPNVECSEEMKDKIVKHVKARKLLITFAGVIFPWILLVGVLIPIGIIEEMDKYNAPFPPAMWIPLLCFGVLVVVLGGIFGFVYMKKKIPNFDWQKKRVWSNAAMLCTVSVLGSTLLAFGIIFGVLIYSPQYYSEYLGFTVGIPMALYAAYNIAFYSVAGALKNKGEKLSLAVYGAKHPRQSKVMKEQRYAYILQKEAYIKQKNAYLAERNEQRKVWRKYRRELVYYEEGIAPLQRR